MIIDHTFPKTCRLTKSKDYKQLHEVGRVYHTSHFVMLVKSGHEVSRLGLTVSRKVGNAVCRNRLKRWIRELFRHHYMQFSQATDVVVIAKRQAGLLSHAQVDRELLKMFACLETKRHD